MSALADWPTYSAIQKHSPKANFGLESGATKFQIIPLLDCQIIITATFEIGTGGDSETCEGTGGKRSSEFLGGKLKFFL